MFNYLVPGNFSATRYTTHFYVFYMHDDPMCNVMILPTA